MAKDYLTFQRKLLPGKLWNFSTMNVQWDIVIVNAFIEFTHSFDCMIPSEEDYWRALILYGKTQSTYKMALGKCLIRFASDNVNIVDMDELASYFLNLYRERCESGKPQLAILGRTTFVEQEIHAMKYQGKPESKALEVVKKDCLNNMVLKKFNNLYNRPLEKPFYSVSNDGRSVILNDNLLNLFSDSKNTDLSSEVESRWDLLEFAFGVNPFE